MSDSLRTMLGLVDAELADIRYEIRKEIVIQFNGNELVPAIIYDNVSVSTKG
jgi:hypothetical protein